MAAALGEKLLGEIRQERLDEVLHDLRGLSRIDSESCRNTPLGIAQIDRVLDVFMPNPTRVPQPPQPPSVPADEELGEEHIDIELLENATHSEQPPPATRDDAVVEISSMTSAAGKSQLLYYISAIAILPTQFDGCPLGGRESAVVFIDTDGSFNADRLRIITRGIVSKAVRESSGDISAERERESPGYLDEEIEQLLDASLRHVHVFRPFSSTSLLATLHTLDTYLFNLSRHCSSNRPLYAVLIDSASAFFWEDKLHDEVSRIEEIGRSLADIENDRRERHTFYLSDMYADIVAELKRLQRRFSCAVIYTTTIWSGRPMASSHTLGGADAYPVYQAAQPHTPSPMFSGHNLGGSDAYPLYPAAKLNTPSTSVSSRNLGGQDAYPLYRAVKPHAPSCRPSLPAPWGTFPTVRLVVRREVFRSFPSSTTVPEARGEASQRHDMVLRGRFTGWVNSWGCDDWPRSRLEQLERMDWGRFVFHVRRDQVTLG